MRLRIGQRVLLMMLVVIVPSLLILSLLALGATEKTLRDKVTHQLQELTEKAVQNVEALIGDSKHTLRSIAASHPVREAIAALETGDAELGIRSLEGLDEALLDFQKMDGSLQAIRLIDAEGYVLSKVREGRVIERSEGRSPFSNTPSVSTKGSRTFFRKTLQLGPEEVWVSNLERGWVEEGEPWCPAIVRFSTPLFFSDGRLAGVLVINVWGETVGTLVNRMISEEEGTAFLVERNPGDSDRHGIYLFHHDNTCVFGNQTGSRITALDEYPPGIIEGWMSRERGVQIHPETDDILAHRFYSPYGTDERGWVIVVNARKSFFLGPLSTITQRILGASALVLTLTVLGALFFTRSLLRPIRTVVDGAHAIGRDLSFRIRTDSRDEIGDLASEINQMAEALQANLEQRQRVEEQIHQAEKLASIGEMASGLAHELNTPLGNIRALAALCRKDLARDHTDLKSLEQDLADIEAQTGRCSQIITGLLGFARRQNPELALWDPADLVRKALELVRLPMEKKGIRPQFRSGDDLPSIRIDGHLMQQVLVNMLLNAVDAASKGGRIRIDCTRVGDALRISISDDGAGIRPEHLGKIFDPFFTTKEPGKGTGLGLSVSYGIVKNQGGEITVESTPGEETSFHIHLPYGGM